MKNTVSSPKWEIVLTRQDLKSLLGFYEVACNRSGAAQDVTEVDEINDDNVDAIASVAEEAGFDMMATKAEREFELEVLDAIGPQRGRRVFTSFYGNMKVLRKFKITPVRIAQYAPRFEKAHGADVRLAPSKQMLADLKAEIINSDQFKLKYVKQLQPLDAKKVHRELLEQGDGGSVAILCYEKPPQRCHREYVAAWMKEAGLTVTEFPFKP